jgi:Dyp-type peroxidase family
VSALPIPAAAPLPLDDVQGVILRGFRSFRSISHLVFTIADAAGARKLCALLVPGSGAAMTVTQASPWSDKPAYCLNMGVTHRGLTKLIGASNYASLLQANPTILSAYDRGADSSVTAGIVGDTGDSAPSTWWQRDGGWSLAGTAPSSAPLDILITIYTQTPDSRTQFVQTLVDMIPPGADGTPSVKLAYRRDCDPLDPPDGIHFGYVDGISQPRVEGFDDSTTDDDRPSVPPFFFVVDGAPAAAPYTAAPFLTNGGFGAFRVLYQDVAKFQAFVGQAGDQAAQDLLAAKMCGRWKDGTPIEVSPDGPDPSLQGFDLSNFNYLSASAHQKSAPAAPDFDTYGQRCPYASHTRRTNPRDDSKFKASADAHRVMRRAFAYGPEFSSDPSAQRGLAGLFMGAVLTDQFEFVMQTWMSTGGFRSPDLSPNASGCDPLFGPQPGNPGLTAFDALPDSATLPPTSADYQSTPGLDRFVRTDGSLYVFLPSVHALTAMGKGGIA